MLLSQIPVSWNIHYYSIWGEHSHPPNDSFSYFLFTWTTSFTHYSENGFFFVWGNFCCQDGCGEWRGGGELIMYYQFSFQDKTLVLWIISFLLGICFVSGMSESYLLNRRLFMTYHLESFLCSEQMQCLGQQKVTCQELSPHLSLLLKGIGQDPNIFVSQKLEVWAASLSPYRSVSRAAHLCLLFFFFESVVCWVSELWVSAKKVLEIWIIILMTSESMGQKKNSMSAFDLERGTMQA